MVDEQTKSNQWIIKYVENDELRRYIFLGDSISLMIELDSLLSKGYSPHAYGTSSEHEM